MDRWNNWDSSTKLQNIFDTKCRIMSAVKEVKGHNEYKIPRSKKSHVGEKPTYIPTKRIQASDSDSSEGEGESECEEVDQVKETEETDIQKDELESEIVSIENDENFEENIENEILEFWERRKSQLLSK